MQTYPRSKKIKKKFDCRHPPASLAARRQNSNPSDPGEYFHQHHPEYDRHHPPEYDRQHHPEYDRHHHHEYDCQNYPEYDLQHPLEYDRHHDDDNGQEQGEAEEVVV